MLAQIRSTYHVASQLAIRCARPAADEAEKPYRCITTRSAPACELRLFRLQQQWVDMQRWAGTTQGQPHEVAKARAEAALEAHANELLGKVNRDPVYKLNCGV